MAALPAAHLLEAFNRAGVLGAADVHVALRLGAVGGESDPRVLLAAALAVRAPRVGHVRADLAGLRDALGAEAEEVADVVLPWPDPEPWLRAVEASPLVSVGPDGPADRPLRLLPPDAVYLDRHWRDERLSARLLLERARAGEEEVDDAVLAEGLGRLFPEPAAAEQRWAAACAVLRRLSVVAGGPGTGKTTTVAGILLLLEEQAAAARRRPPLVALAAPTGKAATRLEESVRSVLGRLVLEPGLRSRLDALDGSTLHRLLGPRPGRAGRFRHDRNNHLPHDVVVVDETSMVSAGLMARLLEAVRPEARLVLLGDPGQLSSVEAGMVLADVAGPAASAMTMSEAGRARLRAVTGADLPVVPAPPGSDRPLGDSVVVLRTNHRFRGALGGLSAALQAGSAEQVLDVLRAGPGHDGPGYAGRDPDAEGVSWIEADPESAPAAALSRVRALVTAWGGAMRSAALAGDGPGCLEVLGSLRVLCGHRHGPSGAGAWNERIEAWLAESDPRLASEGRWYPGRPVMVTINDYGLRLFNGDTGVTVASQPAGTASVLFGAASGLRALGPARLPPVETVYATTVHKAQGSEFSTVIVLVPDPASRVLTRQLLYTAVTRARRRLVLVGTEASVRAAVERPVARSSGLRALLWGG